MVNTNSEHWVQSKYLNYEVSDLGRVRRATRAKGAVVGKILTPCLSDGYPQIVVLQDGKKKAVRIHAVVSEAFLGPRPEGMVVNHKDGDRQNNIVGNLEYCTQLDNVLHSIRLGRRQSGDNHIKARLRKRALAILRNSGEFSEADLSLVFRGR